MPSLSSTAAESTTLGARRTGRGRLPQSLGALLGALALCFAAPALAAAPSEYQIKAVFLFNFSQFVTWPLKAFANADSPFVVGVLGRDPFGANLESAVQGERVDGRPIVVRRFRTAAEATDCQILFVDRSEPAALAESARVLQGHSVLSVSDAPDAARLGAVIEFTVDNNRIRLRINVAEARSRGLTISSKLLRPALILGDGGG